MLPSGVGPKLVPDETRKAAIKEAFVWSWDAYEKHAWGDDEVSIKSLSTLEAILSEQLHPLSQTGTNLTSAGGVGYTIIDSIGSLLIMDLIPQYQRARDWVKDSLDFDKDAQFNTFEVSAPLGLPLLDKDKTPPTVPRQPLTSQDNYPHTRRSPFGSLPHFHP